MAGERPSAVRFYAPDHPALVLSVRRKLERYRQDLIDGLVSSHIASFEDYKYRAGVIEGLRVALLLTEESEKELEQRS